MDSCRSTTKVDVLSGLASKSPSEGSSIRTTGVVTWAILRMAREFRRLVVRNSNGFSPVRRKANAGPEGPASSLRPTGQLSNSPRLT